MNKTAQMPLKRDQALDDNRGGWSHARALCLGWSASIEQRTGRELDPWHGFNGCICQHLATECSLLAMDFWYRHVQLPTRSGPEAPRVRSTTVKGRGSVSSAGVLRPDAVASLTSHSKGWTMSSAKLCKNLSSSVAKA